MDDNDKQAFAEKLLATGEIYDKKVSKTLLSVYFEAVKNYSIEEVTDALGKHLVNPDNGHFFPKPADIVRLISGSTESRAMKAWTIVLYGIKHIGPWDSPDFEDPKSHSVIKELGGWQELCRVTDQELPFKKIEFEKRYKAFILEPPEYDYPLIGYAEHQNVLNNHAEPRAAIRIGHDGQPLLSNVSKEVGRLENTNEQENSEVKTESSNT